MIPACHFTEGATDVTLSLCSRAPFLSSSSFFFFFFFLCYGAACEAADAPRWMLCYFNPSWHYAKPGAAERSRTRLPCRGAAHPLISHGAVGVHSYISEHLSHITHMGRPVHWTPAGRHQTLAPRPLKEFV